MRHIIVLMVVLLLLFATSLYSARNFVGEVAILYTTDGGDRTFETQLWVLEHNHKLWIRSVHPTSGWLDRLIQQPQIQLERGNTLKTYRATPLAHRRAQINALMAERYGWAEWLLAKYEGREDAVPVFLDPFG